MDLAALQAFEGAIDDQRDVVAAITVGDLTHFFSAKLLKRDSAGFSFQTSAWPTAIPRSATAKELTVSIQFGTSGAVVELQAGAVSVESNQRADGMETVVLRCGKPREISLIQRRAHFRAPVPAAAPVSLVVWKIPDHWVLRDKPKPSMQLRAELIDISPGGVCLRILPHRVGPESLAKGDRLRAELQFAETVAIFDCRIVYRGHVGADGSARIGVAFMRLENSIEGKRGSALLDRIIGALQRLSIQETTAA